MRRLAFGSTALVVSILVFSPVVAERPAGGASSREERDGILRENLGKPFPDLRLQARNGKFHRLSEFRGRKLALWLGGTAFERSLEWAARLRERNWKVDGWDTVVLLRTLLSHEMNEALKGAPPAFAVQWPLAGFLEPVTVYPVMYFVDEAGTFVGFQWSDREPVMFDRENDP